MKKKSLIFTTLILLIFISKISAIDIVLPKENYFIGETMQGEINGYFVSLKPENIQVYYGDKVHSEALINGLTKQDRKYYFYFLLPYNEGNYSIRINDAEYIEKGKLINKVVIKNFTIVSTNETILSVNPGFVLTSNDFVLKLKSINGDMELNGNFLATGENNNILLMEEIEESMKFSITKANARVSSVKIGNYNIPVFLLKNINNNISYNLSNYLDFEPIELVGTILSEKDYTFNILLENTGNTNLSDIVLTSSFNSILTPNKIDELNVGESTYFNITINIEKNKNILLGDIFATVDEESFNLPVYLNISLNESIIEDNPPIISKNSCLEQSGIICLENEECDGEVLQSLEGNCCKGSCIKQEVKQDSSRWVYLGLLLIVLTLITIYYFFKKSREKQKTQTTDEVYSEKSSKYRKRMLNEGDEVKGRLDKV
ncbi:MAG: hypothetical protein WC867_02515 [Candidatus Pacearchaeota archaeon]|jgi:hypothetical protein